MTDWGWLRWVIHLRGGGYCDACGLPLPPDGNWAAHHRKLRGQGGEDTPENILALHHGCHNGATYAVHLNPAWSYSRGLMVHSWDDPKTVPLIRPNGHRVLVGEYFTDWKENHDPARERGSTSTGA